MCPCGSETPCYYSSAWTSRLSFVCATSGCHVRLRLFQTVCMADGWLHGLSNSWSPRRCIIVNLCMTLFQKGVLWRLYNSMQCAKRATCHEETETELSLCHLMLSCDRCSMLAGWLVGWSLHENTTAWFLMSAGIDDLQLESGCCLVAIRW